jgi:hypothetical protein
MRRILRTWRAGLTRPARQVLKGPQQPLGGVPGGEESQGLPSVPAGVSDEPAAFAGVTKGPPSLVRTVNTPA